MKRSITLVELILAIALILIIILAATSIDLAARNFFNSSDRKTQVLNEVTYILEHIQKHATQASGWVDALGYGPQPFPVNSPTLNLRLAEGNPGNFADDVPVTYQFDALNNRLTFNGNVLSRKILGCTFNIDSNGSGIRVNIRARFDPDNPSIDQRTNPEVEIRTTIFLGQHSFS